MVMWLLSLATAIGTGWLAFAGPNVGPLFDAVFLLSVAGFVACSMWALARLLTPLDRDERAAERLHGPASDDDETRHSPRP